MKRDFFTQREVHLIKVCLDRYNEDLRKACETDQGTPDGKPGTLGAELQEVVREIKKNPLLRAA